MFLSPEAARFKCPHRTVYRSHFKRVGDAGSGYMTHNRYKVKITLSAWSVPNRFTFPTKLKCNFVKDMQSGTKPLEQEMFDLTGVKVPPSNCLLLLLYNHITKRIHKNGML